MKGKLKKFFKNRSIIQKWIMALLFLAIIFLTVAWEATGGLETAIRITVSFAAIIILSAAWFPTKG